MPASASRTINKDQQMKWMPLSAGLGLALLVCTPGAAAPSISQVYLADAEAEIAIGTDGAVTSVELRRTPALEGEVGDRLEERIRNWRFVVMRNEAGDPVPARTRASLVLEGYQAETGKIEVRMSSPRFSARALGEGDKAEDFQVGGVLIHRVNPKWPKGAAQVGARVEVLVEYDASGQVTRAGARKAQLIGLSVDEHQAGRAKQLLQPFVRESERAIARWRFRPATAGQTEGNSAVVPVSFRPVGSQREYAKWEHAVAVHELERDWAQPKHSDAASAPQMVPDDDLSFGLVRLVEFKEGELL